MGKPKNTNRPERINPKDQIVFKVDKKLKEAAMKKAEASDWPLGFILRMVLRAYVNGDLYFSLHSTRHLQGGHTKTREHIF